MSDEYRDEEAIYRGGKGEPSLGNGPGGVRIGNREIYDAVMDLRDRVAGLERRVDSVLQENGELRGRVRGLELKFYGVIAGFVGVFGTIALAIMNGLVQ